MLLPVSHVLTRHFYVLATNILSFLNKNKYNDIFTATSCVFSMQHLAKIGHKQVPAKLYVDFLAYFSTAKKKLEFEISKISEYLLIVRVSLTGQGI